MGARATMTMAAFGRVARSLAVFAVAGVVAVGCVSAGEAAIDARGSGPPTTTDGTGSTTAPTATTEASTTSSVPAPTSTTTTTQVGPPAGEMADVVIQLDDLPAGWTEGEATSDDEEQSFCDDQDPFQVVEPQEKAQSAFDHDGSFPTIATGASRYASSAEATELLDAIQQVIEVCDTYVNLEDNGDSTEWTLEPLPVDELGERTVGLRMTAAAGAPLGDIYLDAVAVQQGDIVVTVIAADFEPSDPALTTTLLATMLTRL